MVGSTSLRRSTSLTTKHFPDIVGITGYARVGKDSTAAVFTSLGYTQRAFADPLKEMALSLNPVLPCGLRLASVVRRYGWELAKVGTPGVRDFLKQLGTAGRDYLGKDVWVEAALKGRPERLVVSDVRFTNEAIGLRGAAEHVLVVRVERPGYEPESDFEREVDDVVADITIQNDGSLDDLRFKVKEAFYDYLIAKAVVPAEPHVPEILRQPLVWGPPAIQPPPYRPQLGFPWSTAPHLGQLDGT